MKYRLEFNEEQQQYHLDNYTHEENTHGWFTIIEHCSNEEFIIYDCYVKSKNQKKLTNEFLHKCLSEIILFLEQLHKHELNIY